MSFIELLETKEKGIEEETNQIWIIKHLVKLIPEIEEQITDFVLHQVFVFDD